MFKLAFYLYAAGTIGIVDFYGYGDLDVAKLRAVLPFHEGGAAPSDKQKAAAAAALKSATGRDAAISGVCCLENGRFTVFVGLAEPGAPAVEYNPRPTMDARMPVEIDKLFQRLDADIYDAVRKNQGEEDDSQGYALVKYPPARADQMKLREWARAHTFQVAQVLENARDDNERAEAAEALGYAERSTRQTEALLRAAFDANENVRNNAVRALLVLCNADAAVARQIPGDRFIPLLHSLVWTDRNKALGLLDSITRGRDPALLAKLRSGAMGPLREMASWKDAAHAYSAAIILGRIAGIEEEKLQAMIVSGKVQEIVKAAQ
jgi:HEAT repeats